MVERGIQQVSAIVESDELEPFPADSVPLPRDRNPVTVYLLSVSVGSRRTLYGALRSVAERYGHCEPERFPWWKLRYSHMQRIRSDLAAEKAPATANKTLTAIRQVLLRCRRLGLMNTEDCTSAQDCGIVKGTRPVPGRALEAKEIAALLECTHSDPILGVRNRAIVMTLAGCGLRRAELAQLSLESWRQPTSQLLVHGKGNKHRLVPLHPAIERALHQWLELRGDKPGPLFCPVRKGGAIRRDKYLSTNAVYDVVANLSKMCEIAGVRPHDFRRTFVSVLLEQGKDLAIVSKLVGHQRVETTARYDRRGEREGRKAISALDSLFEEKP